jgi:hypothetical protein
MARIGITVCLSKGLWTNGINQNAIYLANLLKETGYSVYLIHDLPDEIEDIKGIRTLTINKSYAIPFDLMVQFGFAVHKPFYDKWKSKSKNMKLVFYECGNKFIMDMEAILFKQEEDTVIKDKVKPNQIWSIPQMEKSNLEYYKFLSNQNKATVVPFIWDAMSVEDYCKDNNIQTYTPRETKRVGVLEANSSVMKNMLLPTVILDEYEKEYKDLEKVILYSTDRLRNGETFKSLVTKTQLFKKGIIFSNPRLPVLDSLNKELDFVLSWQWENNLNYLWFDVAWMGWPVIHNGSLCQDIGYYYEEFKVKDAISQLRKAIESHGNDIEYIVRNRKVIERYTHKNEKLKEQYKMLVENVLNNEFKEHSYDWKTNSIE